MAAYTSTTSGRFSAGSTWVGGVAPSADGDTWTIANGHTVDYDYDNSALTNGWGACTVTGTLRALGELAISNDGNGTISSMSGITGLTPLYMTSNKVYPSVVDDGGGNWHIDIYKEVGRTTKIAHTGNITGNGSAVLTADGGSGVGGSITIANFSTIAADTDIIASGYFYCKMNGAISGAGTVSAGSDVTAYPSHLWIRFEQTKTSGDLFAATSMTLRFYCDNPVVYRTTLSGVEAIGQTALSVADNLTTDAAHWINGAMVRIDDLGVAESEERTIDSISATELTVTAGLTAAKQVGAMVTLVSRNISLLGTASNQGNAINGGNGGIIRASIRRFASAIAGTNHLLLGTVSSCQYGFNGPFGCTNRGTISGCTTGMSFGSGNLNDGIISGCGNGLSYCSGYTNSGTITCCTNGINQSSGILLCGSNIVGNSNDIVAPSVVCGYGARLQSATPVSAYTTAVGLQSPVGVILYDYANSGGVPQVGWFKSWMQSGTVATGAATVGGPTNSHLHTFANATDQLRLDVPIHLQANVPYKWTIQVKSAQAPNGMTLRPTFSICDPRYLPYDASESLASVAVPNDTNTAWQTVTLIFTPTETREYTLRGSAQNASGSFEWWYTRAAAVFPAQGNTSTAETAYGPTGAEYAGTMPTTAATTASVNADDAATLTGTTLNADGTDTTVAFGASNGTAKSAAVYTAGQAAQLAADFAKISTPTADKILVGTTANAIDASGNQTTVAGTFDEAARNTDPGVGNVRSATGYKIANVSKTGTLDVLADNPGLSISRGFSV